MQVAARCFGVPFGNFTRIGGIADVYDMERAVAIVRGVDVIAIEVRVMDATGYRFGVL